MRKNDLNTIFRNYVDLLGGCMNKEIGFEGLQGLFGDDYLVRGLTQENARIIIHIKSNKTSDVCPICGEASTGIHSTYTREIQDTPMRNMQTWLHVSVHKFDCLNPQCEVKVFAEALPFAGCSQVRTHELTLMALATACNLGNETASQVLTSFGVRMSNDTIMRLYDELDIKDDPNVEEIGIDDVSNRKGQSYFTVIYDLKTHRLLAMLEGRDGEPLKEWLKKHNRVRLVARDRDTAYASAVSEILPEAVQVADRFHLIKNMLDRVKDVINAAMPSEVCVYNGEVLERPPKKEVLGPVVDMTLISGLQYDNSPPVGEDGQVILFDSKNRDLDRLQYKAQAESRKIKQQLIRNIRKYKNENLGASLKELAAIFEISMPTVKKYLKMTGEEIDAMDSPLNYKKRETVMDNFINIIFKMHQDNMAADIIFAYVRHCGFNGNSSTLADYIEKVKRNNFPEREVLHHLHMMQFRYPEGVEGVSRGALLKYILTCNPKTQLNAKVGEVIGLVKEKFPVLAEAGRAFQSFHSIIMGDSPEALDEFLEAYSDSVYKPLCDSIKKDIAPVKYAISLPVSSGFVEGLNNKFKLLKRSLYGRSKFVNLYKKCMLAFAPKDDPAFSVRELLFGQAF